MVRLKILQFYCLCTLCVLLVVLFILSKTSTPTGNARHTDYVPLQYRDELFSKTPQVSLPHPVNGFLINNQACRIKEMDPSDRSVIQAVFNDPPANYIENYTKIHSISYVKGANLFINQIQLNALLPKDKKKKRIKCCYRPIYRGVGVNADSYIRYAKECYKIAKKAKVKVEIFQVECSTPDGSVIYKHSHSVILIKSKVEKKSAQANHKFTSIDEHLSVLIVGIEGTSFNNFERFMKKSRDLLASKSAVKMLGYTSVGENTYPNLIPFLTGISSQDLQASKCHSNHSASMDNCQFIWNSFSKYGFRTSYIEDSPKFNLFASRGGFIRPPTDYYFKSQFLANMHSSYNDEDAAPILSTEETLDLTFRFAKTFSKKKYFSFTWLNSLTHGNMLNAPVLDVAIHNFLQKIFNQKILNSTVLILMSDHGPRYGSYRRTMLGWSEAKHPVLYLSFPDWFLDRHAKMKNNLYHSASKLTTPYDLHETLKNILFHEHYRQLPGSFVDEYEDILLAPRAGQYHKIYQKLQIRGISLLRPIAPSRTCKQAFIPEMYCPCYAIHQISHRSDFIPNVVDALISNLNSMTESMRHICVYLTLKDIIDVRVMIPNNSSDQYNVLVAKNKQISPVRYLILFSTSPGDAVFEAVFQLSSDYKAEDVEVVRVNKIRSSDVGCVSKPHYKLYCYCKKS